MKWLKKWRQWSENPIQFIDESLFPVVAEVNNFERNGIISSDSEKTVSIVNEIGDLLSDEAAAGVTDHSYYNINPAQVRRKKLIKRRPRTHEEQTKDSMEKHKILPPCHDVCPRKCNAKINVDRRISIYDQFWSKS